MSEQDRQVLAAIREAQGSLVTWERDGRVHAAVIYADGRPAFRIPVEALEHMVTRGWVEASPFRLTHAGTPSTPYFLTPRGREALRTPVAAA